MKQRQFAMAMSALALAAASFAANAGIQFQNLGTNAPPATIGTHAMTPFDQGPQAAIANFTNVTVIPGGPGATTVGVSVASNKRTIGSGWASWSHAYTGAVYYTNGATQVTLTLPAGTKAFYAYVEPNPFSFHNITATSDSGTSSGAVSVTGSSGANGFAFYSTAGENITSITITGDVDFAFGEFGIASKSFTTCSAEGFTGPKLTLCRQICEIKQSPSTLSNLIKLYMALYRQEPPCAR